MTCLLEINKCLFDTNKSDNNNWTQFGEQLNKQLLYLYN